VIPWRVNKGLAKSFDCGCVVPPQGEAAFKMPRYAKIDLPDGRIPISSYSLPPRSQQPASFVPSVGHDRWNHCRRGEAEAGKGRSYGLAMYQQVINRVPGKVVVNNMPVLHLDWSEICRFR
jgi:hypothetical protein